MNHKPIIGITLDHEDAGGYSTSPWYAARENYFTSIAECGGVPIALPHEPDSVNQYADMIDGLVLTGGAFDIPPSMYGDKTKHETVTTKEKRTIFEFSITKKMLKLKKPILGICGGEQLINVALGGSLIQHIPAEVKNCIKHEVKIRNKPAHKVKIEKGSLLHKITGKTEIGVNTSHHQAVKKTAPGVVANAFAPDGVIEGIEYKKHPFCLGVQWHPEYLVSDADRKIIQAFIKATKK